MDYSLQNTLSSTYQVNVPVFEGPLDLLLQLIEQSELDITSLSLAMVTDQYLQYIHLIQNIEPDEISSFMVIAAKLIQIKSEALLPRPPSLEPGAEDLNQNLIQQLVLYKKFKEISLWLQERETKRLKSFLRLSALPVVGNRVDLSYITISELLQAAEEVFQEEKEKQNLGSVITPPRITIREKIAHLSQVLKKERTFNFNSIIKEAQSKLEVVVTFLALLELIKQYRVSVFQEALFSNIEVEAANEFIEQDEFELEFGE